jgi:exoribonuclease R
MISKMIPGILELASRTKYGMTSRNVPLYLFRPLNTKLSKCIVGCSHISTTNVLALVEVPDWITTTLTRGHLVRLLGPCGDFKAEREALIHQYSTTTWKKDLKFKTPSLDRHQIQGISFNIDPHGCEDIDDVFTIGDDGYYYITIADVAEWILENSNYERSRTRKGTNTIREWKSCSANDSIRATNVPYIRKNTDLEYLCDFKL